MIHFRAAADRSLPVRLAVSPLWECLISVRVAHHPARSAVHSEWARRAGSALDPAGLELVSSLVESGAGYIPDFLAPPPARAGCEFGAEIDRLLETPAAVVRNDLARAAKGPRGGPAAALLQRFRGREQGLLTSIARELERYWAQAIRPE